MDLAKLLTDIVLFCVIVVPVSFASFLLRKRRRNDLAEIETYSAYVPKWVRTSLLIIGLCALATVVVGPWLSGGLLLCLVIVPALRKPSRFRTDKQLEQEPIKATSAWLAGLGPDHPDRVKSIDMAGWSWAGSSGPGEVNRRIV